MFRSGGAINLFGGGIIIAFGHVGIYDSSTRVIEAGLCGPPGVVAGVYRQSVSEPCWRSPGISRAFVSGRIGDGRSMVINNTALARARKWANEGRPYNLRFYKNKENRGNPPRGSFNCSQLVWSAYLPYVDLDNDPGNLEIEPHDERVMPDELIKHRQINFY